MKYPAASSLRVLVTGYGGFLGSEIVRQLIARGNQVSGLGRRRYPHLEQLPIDVHEGDVRDLASVEAAVQGVDAVIHTAAIAGIWGPAETFFSINTEGTENVVSACRKHAVRTLVYCSSPSVTFDGEHQTGIDESAPYPDQWLCHYPRTKALGEQAVLKAHDPGVLHTLALRPHLIWGAEDPHLFPRLLDRARRRRLRVIGDGNNRIDTVHVRNAAHAHVLGLDALVAEPTRSSEEESAGGRAYFITQDEPVNCWDWISEILTIGGTTLPPGRLSFATAWKIGAGLEWIFHLTRRSQEPPMTRFLAAQLAKDHFFDISAAKRLLGYQPIISMDEGLEELRQAWGSD